MILNGVRNWSLYVGPPREVSVGPISTVLFQKGCVTTLQALNADVIILSETKYNPADDYKKLKNEDQKLMNAFHSEFKGECEIWFCVSDSCDHTSVSSSLCFLGYHLEWCPSTEKKGYAGVLLMSKTKPINVSFHRI